MTLQEKEARFNETILDRFISPGGLFYKKSLVAINKLLKHYKRYRYKKTKIPPAYGTETDETCPLCTIYIGSCEYCPWMLFEKKHCMDAKYYLHKTITRISRLEGWKKIYKGEDK